MTHQYLVEPLQCLGVAWFVSIMAYGAQWRPRVLLAHLIGATAFATLAKVSSPLYCFLPGLAGVWLLLRRQAPEGRLDVSNTRWNNASLAAAVLLGLGAAGWYAFNWATLAEYVRSASSGPISENYGERLSFLSKLHIWLVASAQSFAYPSVLLVLAFLFALALFAAVGRWRRDRSAPVPWSTLAVVVAAAEIILALCVFSTQVNDDRRYLLPLAPFAGLLLAWALARLRSLAATLLAACALSIQWGLIYAQAFAVTPLDPAVSYYLLPLTADGKVDRDDVETAVGATCPQSDAHHYALVGVDLTWFNANLLAFASAKHLLVGGYRCDYWTLSKADSDVSAAWDRMRATNVDYFVTLDPAQSVIPDDFLNHVSLPILERVRSSELFTPLTTMGHPRLMIFKRSQGP